MDPTLGRDQPATAAGHHGGVGSESRLHFYPPGLLVEETDLNWTMLAPAAEIFPGERTGQFRLGKDDLIVDADGNSRISVQDYALAMINGLEQPQHVQQRFTLGY